MNLLIDIAPRYVTVDGLEHPIRWGFRTSIRFEQLMLDAAKSEEQKLVEALHLYYAEIPRDVDAAVERMLWFYRGGEDIEAAGKGGDGGVSGRIYDYAIDGGYIYAAFLQQYGVNLQRVGDLHWWEFRAMLLGLKDDCKFVQILGYRGTKPSSKMSSEQRAHLRKMQKLYALPKPKEQREKERAIEDMLMNGGKLRG